ncbi:glycoside hydrolase family 38 N-terminal domain-containing protein [Nocardiopsis kunsanensis]|uniref:glycoside hydrolase family 38 N-terminal domain-containing protein n=1 Tax=Nocardiopsis kunsanensis TaxID=141693 RepID=UPI0027E50914|nr:hypothetical protein [Nocardiopsis kunsanensis]
MRTSANVLSLIHDPDLFARIGRAAREGRFVPVGGMWVESGTDMPGSEALARQFSFGKRFFRGDLGVDTQEVWLPDSFGCQSCPRALRPSGRRRTGSHLRGGFSAVYLLCCRRVRTEPVGTSPPGGPRP